METTRPVLIAPYAAPILADVSDQPSAHGIPLPPTRLIGREDELRWLCTLLAREGPRLITLAGPGGVGKTRLAVAAAERVQKLFPGGLWYVDLTPLSDPTLVVPTIARAIGVGEGSAAPPLDALAAYVGQREMLMLLDNFEHVLAAAVDIDALLATCSRLRMLLTSREPLNLRREQIVEVRPFPVPCARRSSWTVGALQSVPAVEFFVDRARAADSSFELSETNAEAVIDLTRRLDGLPLALELAAARTRLLEPRALLERVDGGMALLRWNTSDLPPRQRTLRSTLDWSYALLNAEEQAVFRRLGVFAGGFTIDAAAAVAGTDGLGVDALDVLSALTDKHLVRALGGTPCEPRFGQLATVQEYAREQLAGCAEDEETRDRHLGYYLQLVEQAGRARRGPTEALWLSRLNSETDNLRRALDWAIDRGNVQAECQLVAGLALFWEFRGYLREGTERIEAALSRPGDPGPRLRARVLEGAGTLSYWLGDNERAVSSFGESLVAARSAGENALAARVLGRLAAVEYSRGAVSRSHALIAEMLALARSADDGRMIGYAFLYRVLFANGPYGCAREREQLCGELDEPVARLRAAGPQRALALLLGGRARLLAEGNAAAAHAPLREALELARQLDQPLVIGLIPWLGLLLLAGQLPEDQVARLAGGVDTLVARSVAPGGRNALDIFGAPQDRTAVLRAIAAARAALNEEEFSAAYEAGRVLSQHEVIGELLAVLADEALTLTSPLLGANHERQTDSRISPREREVLALLAEGRSNKSIAEALFVAPSTIKTHVTSLLTKLDAENRAHLAAISAQQEFLAG